MAAPVTNPTGRSRGRGSVRARRLHHGHSRYAHDGRGRVENIVLKPRGDSPVEAKRFASPIRLVPRVFPNPICVRP